MIEKLASSYRDRAGFVFNYEGTVYRYVFPIYFPVYDQLMNSGLYDELVADNRMIPHEEMPLSPDMSQVEGRVLKPFQLHFVSYPYEWSFNMWKDAALLTLNIAMTALEKGMMLKDATPYNVQFVMGKATFIDTLSFEPYREGSPWIAYRQFCETFLAPLLLMKYGSPDAGKISMLYPEGIPLKTLARMLPMRARLKLGNLLHVFLQSMLYNHQSGAKAGENAFSKKKMMVLLTGLRDHISSLKLPKQSTQWDSYYTDGSLDKQYLDKKNLMVKTMLINIEYDSVVDLGANDGYFSLRQYGKRVVAIDSDPNCIDRLYLIAKTENSDLHPILADLAAPSPEIGFANRERESLTQRLKGDLILALALVHHLAISRNIPLAMILDWLGNMGTYILVEFIPKEDPKVQLLLRNREDIFDEYTLDHFRKLCEERFVIKREEVLVTGQGRVLFLLKHK